MALLRADIEMANQAIQNLGQNALARRRMQQEHDFEMQRLALEQQMREIQEARYNAQGEHFARSEAAGQEAAAKSQGNQAKMIQIEQDRADALERQTNLKQSVEDFKDAQSGLEKSMQRIGQQVKLFNEDTAAGKKDIRGFSNTEGLAHVMDALKIMPDAVRSKMMQSPEMQAIQSGKFDLETLAGPQQPNVMTTPGGQEFVIDPKTGRPIKGAPPAKDLPPDKETVINGPMGSTTNRTTFLPHGSSPSVPPGATLDFSKAPPASFDSVLNGTGLPGSVTGQSLQPFTLNSPPSEAVPMANSATATNTNSVLMLHPDGKTKGMVPASQLQEAVAAGYKQLQ